MYSKDLFFLGFQGVNRFSMADPGQIPLIVIFGFSSWLHKQ